ncbi:MAG: hypothetical protein IKU86_07845 [Thermoguttaceae bacterium]|nr:hypothetical protein [Thermoguttaceae bacterium]
MTKKNRDAASRVSFDGAQFNAQTIIQTGDDSTANQGASAAAPATIGEILKFLKQNWPYLTSAVAAAGGVWGVCALCVDWVLPTLLWGTSTATTCFVIHGRQTRRQAKEREAAKRAAKERAVEERRRNFTGLSDSASELIVAALNAGDGQIHVKRGYLLVSPLQNDFAFQSDVPPEKRPDAAVVLRELVERGLLIESDDIYYVADFAQECKAELIERDNARIVKTLYGAGKTIFRRTRSRSCIIFCQLSGDNPFDYWLDIYDEENDETPARLVSGQRMLTRQELFDAVELMEKNGLVECWRAATVGKSNPPTYVSNFNIGYHIFKDETSNNPWNSLKEVWNGVAGRLTERGLQIARMFQKAKN